MSNLIRIDITKNAIDFYGVTPEGRVFRYTADLCGSCDDEKWFDIVCAFWDNDNLLDWEVVENNIKKSESEKRDKR